MSRDSTEPFEKHQEAESDLDPRIQIELEALNNATDDINTLETELDEANTRFRKLHNEATTRLKRLNRLGSCIERARPYYEALEVAKQAQLECQKAAVKFQRANEIHQAAKETVALAEARFLSKQHEWEFDSAWQEMLNNAIIKVTDAENQKSESGREHQKKATLFTAAETKVQLLQARLKRAIVKSRPYFEEKALNENLLNAKKAQVLKLREAVREAKARYAASLRRLEDISEEIHMKRRRESTCESPTGPREPGVGAERTSMSEDGHGYHGNHAYPEDAGYHGYPRDSDTNSLDVDFDLDKCDVTSMSSSVTNGSRMSYDSGDESSNSGMNAEDLEKLRTRVRELAATPLTSWNSEAKDHYHCTEANRKDHADTGTSGFARTLHPSSNEILLSPKHISRSEYNHGDPISLVDTTSNRLQSLVLDRPKTSNPTESLPVQSLVESSAAERLTNSKGSSSFEKCTTSSLQSVGSNICKKLQNTIDHPLQSLVDTTTRTFTSK